MRDRRIAIFKRYWGADTSKLTLAVVAGICASTRQLPARNLKIRVTAEKEQQPARLGAFRIEVTAPGLDERHQAGVLRAVKTCLIHNTLLGHPGIDIVVNAKELAHA